MNSRARFTLSAAVLAALTAVSPADARPPVPMTHPAPAHQLKWDSKKFMRVSELRPGMTGYALSVFKGTKIEKFGIEILGVVAKFNEGKDYIMFRATSGPPVTRGLGIAEGMSGSPIYINGRLVGAISLGNQFAKDPIGFATPIEAMLDAWSPDLPAKLPSISASAPSSVVKGLDSTNFQSEMPLSVSGMDSQSLSRLGTALAPFHFHVMAGAGMSNGIDTNPLAKNPSLVPGSAVGVALIQGDFDANATGTVTYRDGNRLLLFGHPFQNLGPIDAALTTAYVVDIYPSYQTSFKLGSPIKTVGRIFQDRPFSVGGVIGPMPQMVPMTVTVHDESIHRSKTFRVRIINHPLLTGRFIPAVAGAAISQIHGDPGDTMAQVTMDVDAEEVGHVKRTNLYFDPLSIDQAATGDLSSLMSLLSSNSFYPLAVKSVNMTVTIQNRHDTAEIDHVFVTQSKFAPGDTVNVGVVLKPYKQPRYTQFLAVKIPQSTPDGVLPLSIQGGSDGGGGGGGSILALLFGGASPAVSSGPSANVSQLVKHFEEKPQNNQIVARLTLPTNAVTVRGEKLSGLPPTLSSVMQSPRTTGYRAVRDEVKQALTVPYLVSGSQTLNIMVQRKNLLDTLRSAPATVTTTTTSTSSASSAAPLSADDSDALAYENRTLITAAAQSPPASTTVTTTSSTTTTTSSPAASDAAAGTSASALATTKPVGRLPSIWRQTTQADFGAGTLTNVAVSSLGDVRLSPSLTKAAETGENYVWAVQPDGHGNAYLATGDSGIVYKQDAAGKVTPFFRTGELEATALALDYRIGTLGRSGALYVGTAPNGAVFRVTPDGKGSKVFTAKEKYITALAESDGEVYIATGGGTGRIYRLNEHLNEGVNTSISNSYESQLLFTSPETHILSLTVGKDGAIYAGSAPNGIVYKIVPNINRVGNGGLPAADPQASVLYDAAEPNITALTTDSQGNVYAGTSAAGNVYKIAPDGTAKKLAGLPSAGVTSLKTGSDDSVYAAAGGTITKIAPDSSVQTYTTPADPQFISLAVDPETSALYAGTGTGGSVYRLGAAGSGGASGLFQSTVHDAGRQARWGTLAWRADTPGGSQITLQTRSGDVPRPDASWSAWSAPYTQSSGMGVTSPPARYVQYQAQFSGGAAPKMSGVSLYYLPRNQAPIVSLTKPSSDDALSKTAALNWTAVDPDKDTLSYDVSYSADGGKTWKPITASAQLKSQTKTKAASATAPAVLASLKNAPASVQALVKAQIAANSAADTPKAPKSAQDLKETSYAWDTTSLPDGLYQIEVVASDRPSNPVGALTAKADSQPFLVVNTPPTLTVGTPVVSADKSITLHGTAQTKLAFVQAVQAKTDGGDAVAASADDGLFDSTSEPWTLTLPTLTSGPHKIEVQALDQAGNKATQTVSVTVP